MIKNELKRCFKSIYSIVMPIICVVPILFSYYFTWVEQKELLNTLNSGAVDVDIDRVKQIYEGYNGFTYWIGFLASSDFYMVFVIAVSMLAGLLVASKEYKLRLDGLGNFIITRADYSKMTWSILTANILYVISILFAVFVFMTMLSLFFFPVEKNAAITVCLNMQNPTIQKCIGFIVIHFSKLMIYMICCMMLSYGLSILLNNKYWCSLTGLFLYFGPLVIVSILGQLLGGVSSNIVNHLSAFVPDRFLLSSVEFYATERINWADEFVLPVFLIVVVFFIMNIYLVRGKKAYL
ncbi:MAG: hypothetical protein J1E62_07755 [Lachnospiraceae bacterium]|nr:hypothetical protein [Lachnospiraceae bacterium]